MDDLNIFEINITESETKYNGDENSSKYQENERHIKHKMFQNIDLHYNKRLLVSFKDKFGLKFSILDLNSPTDNCLKSCSLKDFRKLNLLNNECIEKSLLLNENKYMLCYSKTHYFLYDLSLETIVYEYYKPEITFIQIYDKFIITGQKRGTVSLFECDSNQCPVMLSTIMANTCVDKEIIDISIFQSCDSFKLMVLAKGSKPVFINGITGDICSVINGSPKLFKPSSGAFVDSIYYLSYCQKCQNYDSVSEFKPRVMVFELQNENEFKRIGKLDFSYTNGFITSMFVINRILFIHLYRGSHWQIRRYSQLELLSITYCHFEKIIPISSHLVIGCNQYGMNWITCPHDRKDKIIIHWDKSSNKNDSNKTLNEFEL